MAVSYVSYETAVQAYAVERAKRRDIPTFFFARGRGETQRVEGTGPARPGAPAVGARGAQHRLRQGRCLMRCPSGSLVLPYRLWTITTSVHFVIQRNSCLIPRF